MTNHKTKKFFILGLIALFFVVLAGPITAHAVGILPDISDKIDSIQTVLSDTSPDTAGGNIKGVWTQLINLINGFMIGLLIFIAFAQILRINVNTYGVKKVLPALLMAIIATNFSWLFCRLLVDIANVVMAGVIQQNSTASITEILQTPNWAEPGGSLFDKDSLQTFSGVFWFIIAQFMLLALAILMIILAFLFFIRIWVVYFLVALSPLAFMSLVLPQTKTVFNQWWSNFSKWVFMPVVSVFWIWLGGKLMEFSKNSEVMSSLFAGVCFYMALTTPFKMGGAVMNAWGGLGKKAWKKTGGFVTDKIGEGARGIYDRQKLKLKNRLTSDPEKPTAKTPEELAAMTRRQRALYKAKRAYAQSKYGLNKFVATPGKMIDRAAAKQRFYTQQEKDVRAKSIEAADKQIYKKALELDATGKKKLIGGAKGRAIAKMRKFILDDQEGYRGADPTVMQDWLAKNGFLDTEGKLKSEAELLKLKPDDYIEGKAKLKEIREQARRPITKDDAQPVWESLFRDDPGDTPGRRAKMAMGQDIARDLLSTSAVGDVAMEAESVTVANTDAKHKMASILGNEKADALLRAATHGNTEALNSLVESMGLENLDDASREVIKNAVDGVRLAKQEMVEENFKGLKEEIEDEMIGIDTVLRMKDSGMDPADVLLKAKHAANVPDAAATLRLPNLGAEDLEEQVKKRMDHLEKGLSHFNGVDGGVGSVADRASYIRETSINKLNDAHKEAEATTTAQIVSASLSGNPAIAGMTAAQASTNPEILHEIRNSLAEHHSDANPLNQTLSLRPQDQAENAAFMRSMQTMSEQVVKTGMNAFFANNPNKGASASAAEVFSSPEFVKSMAKAVKKGNEASAPQTVKVENMPQKETIVQQAPSGRQEPPKPPQTPPMKPDIH